MSTHESAFRRRARSLRQPSAVEFLEARMTVSDTFLSLLSGIATPAVPTLVGPRAAGKESGLASKGDSWVASIDTDVSQPLPVAARRLEESRAEAASVVQPNPPVTGNAQSADPGDWLVLFDVPNDEGEASAGRLLDTGTSSIGVTPPLVGGAISGAARQPMAVGTPTRPGRPPAVAAPAGSGPVLVTAPEAGGSPVEAVMVGPARDSSTSNTTHGTVTPFKAPEPETAPVVIAAAPSPSGGTIEAKRVAPGTISESFYPVKYGEHFDNESTFEFRLVNDWVTTNRPIGWKVWDAGYGPNSLLASGTGTAFTYKFPNGFRNWGQVDFIEDTNLDGQFNEQDQNQTNSTFWVQPRFRYVINVDVSSVLAPGAAAAVQNRLLNAQNLLLKKDGTDDYRACVSFEAGTINTFTASPARPDPVVTLSDAELHFDAAADIVFVDDLQAYSSGAACDDNDWHQIIIEWAMNDTTIAHEFGHGVGLHHIMDPSIPAYFLMVPGGDPSRNSLQDFEADSFD